MSEIKVKVTVDGSGAEQKLSNLNKQVQGLANAQNVVATSSRRADYALFNFGRIVQDGSMFTMGLNMGMMSIANNISPFLESMKSASQEAGGFRGASQRPALYCDRPSVDAE